MNDTFLAKIEDEKYEELEKGLLSIHPGADLTEVRKAFQVARKAHKKQLRKSGDPYIIHPLAVAAILGSLEMDKDTLVAGILHDVVEDTDMTCEDLKQEFGEEVASLVDGVTKLTKLKYSSDKIEVQAENLRKMFMAMSKDIRVIIIKLADRLHNMRTLQYMTRDKQRDKSRETMEIFSPIAQRIGISRLKDELDDLALKYSEPDVYYELTQNINKFMESREQFITDMIEEMKGLLKASGVEAEVDGRVKHTFSIYKKMKMQDKSLDQIYDIIAIRIKVETLKDCYAALGVIHEEYTPVPGRFKDYIAMPKLNNYQSIHTTLMSSVGFPFEVQIRTFDMHKTAEYGIAAHWKYKENLDPVNKILGKDAEDKFSWIHQIIDLQQETADNNQFLEMLKEDLDLFGDYVYCFTPQGDVKALPRESTPVDFAYSIHSAVGNRMIGARVNGKIVGIDYKIQNGDKVDIITSQNSRGPSRDWLNIVKSSQAKTKINQWFRNERREDNIARGKELLDKYMKLKGITDQDIFAKEYTDLAVAKYGFKDWDTLLAAVGHGGLKEGQVINRLVDEYNRRTKKTEMTDEDVLASGQGVRGSRIRANKTSVVVSGLGNVAVRFAKCCSPVPGDEIVGFVTRGRGVTIHRTDCENIIDLGDIDRSRLIDAQWDKPADEFNGEKFKVEITIYARNRVGLLVDISKILSGRNIDVTNISSRTNKQQIATIALGFDIPSRSELDKIIDLIRAVDNVIDVMRTNNS